MRRPPVPARFRTSPPAHRSVRALWRAVAAGAALGLLAAACTRTPRGGGDGDKQPRILRIAFLGSLEAENVVHAFHAAQLAIDQANESGSLPVVLELVAHDTEGSGEVAGPLADRVAADPSFVAVIGPSYSDESLAVGDRLEAADIPFITQSATDDSLSRGGWTHWFRGLGNNGDMGPPAADYIAMELGADSACLASDGSAYGRGLKEAVAGALQVDRVSVVLDRDVEPGGLDYSGLVAAVADAACGVLLYGGYSREAGLIRRQMDAAGLGHVPMVGGDGIKDDAFVDTAGDAAAGTVASCPCADLSTSASPAAQQFISDYQSEYGEAPGIYAAEAYDIAQILIAAIKAESTSRRAITRFLHQLAGFQGLTKAYTFDSDGELAAEAKVVYLYQVQLGRWVPLGPSDEVLGG